MKRRVARIALAAFTAAIGIALLATALLFERDLRAAHARVAVGSLVADTDCGSIEYTEAGEGPPVLVVHGAGGGFDQGMHLAGGLEHEGFRLIAMSRFGYLRTPLPPDASVEAQADAHACLIDHLELEAVAVWAVSAGAPSAAQFALRHPQRVSSLTLMVPAMYVPRPDDEAPVTPPAGLELVFGTALRSDFLLWGVMHVAPRMLVRTMLATPPELLDGASQDDRDQVHRLLREVLPVSARRTGLLNDSHVVLGIEPYPLGEITAPTLVISAVDDLYGTFEVARYTASRIPGARFIGYDSGGHILVGRGEQVLHEVTGFLGEVHGP